MLILGCPLCCWLTLVRACEQAKQLDKLKSVIHKLSDLYRHFLTNGIVSINPCFTPLCSSAVSVC